MRLKTTRAARRRDDFNGFYDQPAPAEAEAYLKRWCYGAKRSLLEPVKEFVKTVRGALGRDHRLAATSSPASSRYPKSTRSSEEPDFPPSGLGPGHPQGPG